MKKAIRKLDRKGKRGYTPAWLPSNEEIERTLQITGSAVRTALAKKGTLNIEAEDLVGLRLLGDLDIGIRHALSRIVRPSYLREPSTFTEEYSETKPLKVTEGMFKDWVVAGYQETQLIIGDGYDQPVESRVQVYSGIAFTDAQRDLKNVPFGIGYPQVWYTRPPQGQIDVPFQGPLTGFDIVRDNFGYLEILAPPPIFCITHQLKPAIFESGLMLLDENGKAAIVCRVWRSKFIGDEISHEFVHQFEGTILLIRPDIFENTQVQTDYSTRNFTYVRYRDTEGKG